jgi:hypothetical protein
VRSVQPIREAMHAQPFHPFSLQLVDGTSCTIDHPDFIAVPPGNSPREVAFFTAAGNDFDDYLTHWIDLGLISTVVANASVPPQPAEGNGA